MQSPSSDRPRAGVAAGESPSDAAPKIDRKDRRERTRERFIQAALDLLRSEGVSGVTVSQLSKRIEVHHTLFYAHFEDISACLAVVATRVLATLAPVDRELRRELMRRAVTDRRALARYFEGALDRWMAERGCVELLLAHRLDRNALGEVLRPAVGEMRDDLAADLRELATQAGVSEERIGGVRMQADLLLNQWLWALEMLIEQRAEGSSDAEQRARLADALADVLIHANLRFLDRARQPSRPEAIAAAYSSERRAELSAQRAILKDQIARHDDAYLVARAGSAEVLLTRVLSAITDYFLPAAAGTAHARVRYQVSYLDEPPIERDLVVQAGTCVMQVPTPSDVPTLVLCMPLRVALETITRARHFDHAFRAGDLRILGDVSAALQYLEWFDYYE